MARYRMLLLFLLLSTALVISGCAPRTLQTLKTEPSGVEEFRTKNSYITVYNILSAKAHDEFTTSKAAAALFGGVFGGAFAVESDIAESGKTGSISIVLLTPLKSGEYMMTTDIVGMGDDDTVVKTYYCAWAWKSDAQKYRHWLQAAQPDKLIK